jgi:hypothetical protein
MAFVAEMKKKDPLVLIAFRLPKSKSDRLKGKYPKRGGLTLAINTLIDLLLEGKISLVNK